MMAAAGPKGAGRFTDLSRRTSTGLTLGALALALFWLGGWWSAALLAVAAAWMVVELRQITGSEDRLGWLAVPLVALAVLVTEASLLRYGLVTGGLAALWLIWRDRPGLWTGLGALYIVAAMGSLDGLRTDPTYGFLAVLWLITVVVASDVGGYFGGRLIGGRKLWPRVSPGKTWSGLLAGVILAALIGAAFSAATTGTFVHEVASVSALTALVAQAGDLLESGVKRRFGADDSGRLLPGHGGLLDRLDGLSAAAIVVAALTFARGQSVFIW
ncbi:MAG: phosphatidate cytidylyltransferase [Pseudomonadota bacterium]